LPDKRHSYDWRFLLWEIEAGNLSAAVHRLNTSVWNSADVHVGMAEQVANAYLASGRSQEAIDLLLQLATLPSNARQSLGKALWRVGAPEQGRAAFREAVASELAAAEADDKKSLPVDLARIQLVMGDRAGALETLARIQALAAPLEYDPQALMPPNPRYTTLTIRAERWRQARDRTAGVLAQAGLDDQAFALLHEAAANQPDILKRIMRGQAARGDFDAAFRTFDRLRQGPLTGPETPLTIMPDVDRPGSYEIRTRTLDTDSTRWLLQQATLELAKLAAHQGRTDPMEKAFSLFREINHRINRDSEWIEVLKEHARAGQPASALRLARYLDRPSTRVAAFAAIAEGVAGLRSIHAYDPLLPGG
jgi:tetratricopeptide (TPR) repeat protein